MNENFFYEENKEKYYVIGWILSDGHVSTIKNFWSIHLHLKDKGMLIKILNLIKSDNNIHGPYKERPSVQIQIVNKKHLEFLTQSWGLDNHKSHNLKWKDCPKEFLPHLVRGYFDGDGSIYTKQSSNPNINTVGINFVGTHDFIKGLQKAINEANQLTPETGCVSDLDSYASLHYNGNNIALKILDWMYMESDSLTRLDRKFEKYIEYKSYIESMSNYNENNKSIKYGGTILPNFEISQKIRFDYEYLNLNITQLSSKYNVVRGVIDGIVKNITHTKSDNRTNRAKFYIEAFGEKKHILDWVNDDRCNVDEGTLRDRIINQKINSEDAITKIPDYTSGTIKHIYEIDGDFKTISEILKDKGISRSAFTYRVNILGLEPVEASEKIPGEIKGVNHAQGKLSNHQKHTQSEIKNARDLYSSGNYTVKQISNITGISESVLYDALGGRTFQDPSYIVDKKQDIIYISYNGYTKTIKEWSDELDIPYSTIDRRYRENLPIEKVLSKEKLPKNKSKKSDKDKKALEVAKCVREDYKNGIVGKNNFIKWGIPKSRYIDLIGNRTCKEENVWWK